MGPGFRRDDGEKMEKVPAVYLLASRRHGTLYCGVTSDLCSRILQHKDGSVPGFTKDYGVKMLVWFSFFPSMEDAIRREKQIKEWRRGWKIELIERQNPVWRDLFDETCGPYLPLTAPR
ncbi:MAG: GIY-YIG nuclease family protein [Hyphomicrobiales bacterium]